MSVPKRSPSDIATYGSAGIQMVLIIGLFVYLGQRLDAYFQVNKPWWTLGLSILGVIIALVFMVKSFDKISKNKKKK